MKVIKLLLRASPAGFALAVVFALLGGLPGTALVHTITKALHEPTRELGVRFVVLVVLQLVFAVASQAVLTRHVQRVVGTLRIRVARGALMVPFPHLEKLGLTRIRASIVEDAGIIGGISGLLVGTIISAVTLLGAFAYLVWLSPAAAASSLILTAGAAFAHNRLSKISVGLLSAARRARSRLFSSFEGIVNGATEIRLHARRREAILEDIDGVSLGVHMARAKGAYVMYAAEAIGQTAVLLGIAAAIVASAAFPSPNTASVVVVLVFMQAPLLSLLALGPSVLDAGVAVDSIEQLLGKLGDVTEREVPAIEPDVSRSASIELSQVSFTYPNAQDGFGVGPIDLTVGPGEIVFLTGGNGSGKTTLAKVLVGLYAAEGQLKLNGKEIVTDEDRELYRNHFAVVFSDGFVFPELWGVAADSVDAKANELLAQLELASKVEVKDGQFSSTQLSTGQKKRLALVAAYLEDRPIFLFDEWAADQDPEFKRLFYTQYLKEIRDAGKSAIVISHDDRYFGVADKVIQLERGRVAQQVDVAAGMVAE